MAALRVRPRGESGIGVAFTGGDRRVSVPEQGYFERSWRLRLSSKWTLRCESARKSHWNATRAATRGRAQVARVPRPFMTRRNDAHVVQRTTRAHTIGGDYQVRPVLVGVLVLIPLSGCLVDHVERRAPASSERQRDSAIGASRLPGAQGVRGALRASDSAAARRAQEDSVAQEP